jgi:bifunctional DNA-binding transcriptional regulator/antitoxin component of YhaV-PrlF toxin-antitoxin module
MSTSLLKQQKSKTVRVSSKGQITLPKYFLKSLGLEYGDFIDIKLDLGQISIFNQKNEIRNQIMNLVGSVKPKINTDLSIEEQIESAKTDFYNSKSLND